MDSNDKDWKTTVGFPINYDSNQSSEDDSDIRDVVTRHGRLSASYLLADGGDGAEADLLGTTPPRTRIRSKEKKKSLMDFEGGQARSLKDNRRNSDYFPVSPQPTTERLKRRSTVKLIRSKERDWKQDIAQQHKADSLPSANPMSAVLVPTLVESCNRFMSLTSRLKCRSTVSAEPEADTEERWGRGGGEELPASRVNFHKMFSMLINMGNCDKGTRRTISREEQVWQNELKDLIWLGLQAKIAGRTLAQQDVFLCAQRNVVPAVIRNIIDYRFVNKSPCKARSTRLFALNSSKEDLSTEQANEDFEQETEEDKDERIYGCLSFNCSECSAAIGSAVRELATLLDSFYNALALYPSRNAMIHDHPHVATQLFNNRLKAMCLWYNIAVHLRLKVLSVRRLLRYMRLKSQRRGIDHLASTESDLSRQSSERQCQVRFKLDTPTPTDSNNSNTSSEGKDDGSHANGVESHCSSDGQEKEGDEVDSGKACERNGVPTPEIVLDSPHCTLDPTASVESGYSSEDGKEDIYHLGDLSDLTELRLLGKCDISPYRTYHNETLKTHSVRRCMMFINKMRRYLLNKVHLTFEKLDGVQSQSYAENEPAEVFDDTKDDEENVESLKDEQAMETYELSRYGCWSEESLAMCLPSYRNHFLLLSSICMEAVHDYLSLRLEGRPERPSCLTVKQLIHELKEGLDIATEVRAAFVGNIAVALRGHRAGAGARKDLLLVIRTFDDTVETVMKQYLSYLTTMSEVEHMSRSTLEAEWAFTARLAKRIKCAALLAPVTFSDIACNQMNRILKQFENNFEELSQIEKREGDLRHMVYALCRAAQSMYARERETTLQAAQWARALSSRLARARPPCFARQRADIFRTLMSLRSCIVRHTLLVLERSRISALEEAALGDGVSARIRELLLQIYKLGFELNKEVYKFAQAPFKLNKTPPKHRPSSLQPIRHTTIERRRRPETMIINESINPLIHKELHRFVNEPSNRSVIRKRSVQSMTSSPPHRPRVVRSESVGDELEGFDDRIFDHLSNIQEGHAQSSIELILAGEQPPEEKVELRMTPPKITAEEQEWAVEVARAVVDFARCWMKFVMERCDRGRGLRPRWASQGLEFLMLACDPYNTKHLTEEEFEELKQLMDECISHVVGSRPTGPRAPESAPAPPLRRRTVHSPLPSNNTSPAIKGVPAPPTPPTEPDPLLSFHGFEISSHTKRVLTAIHKLDEVRDEKLHHMKAIGRELDAPVTSYEPKLRQVTFKWQRGLKIGAGTYGKVYTVVNTESGQLLAMKELSIVAGDRRALQRAANELRVLEGVVHPHLVRYYGCEVHREEMLIFMELCVEGSLEGLLARSGALPEHTIRSYTKQLVSAVTELHARNIAHRDIKSGNIFLTNEGHCLKLGDFGCAVKIRATTTAAGELKGCVGTQAYMAPEVFMKSSGHGRAADIWSLGCVVTEMASGKRPFSKYDSSYQIMFMVGSGERPCIAETLSDEGRDFCLQCLTHEPELRPRAEQLAMHTFLMLKSDDDCKCEPAYFITSNKDRK